jgi:hypothetical protein
MGETFLKKVQNVKVGLSHFVITSYKSLKEMFRRSTSLKTIYAGNWNVGIFSSNMFYECDNLRGGKGTKIGDNYYIDENGVQRSYKCYDSGWAAHIDGGKDWPGLFTAK